MATLMSGNGVATPSDSRNTDDVTGRHFDLLNF